MAQLFDPLRSAHTPTLPSTLRQVASVARREIRSRLFSKAFALGTLLTVGIVVATIVLPHYLSSHAPIRVDVVRSSTANKELVSVVQTISQAARQSGSSVEVYVVANLEAGQHALVGGGVSVVVGHNRLYTLRPVTATSTGTIASFTLTLAQDLGFLRVVSSSLFKALPLQSANELLHPVPYGVVALKAAASSPSDRVLATYGLIFSFLLISLYNGWVMIGVIEEKSSRVIEVLLSVLTARQLLLGKVIGIGLVALAQGSVLVAAALVAALTTGSHLFQGGGTGIVVAFFLSVLLGYALFSVLAAAAGALVSRVEDAQSVSIVVQLPLLISYLGGLAALSGSASPLLKVLAYFPLTAAMVAPPLYANGNLDSLQLAISYLSSSAGVCIVAFVGVRMYEGAVMRVGARVGFRDALKWSREGVTG